MRWTVPISVFCAASSDVRPPPVALLSCRRLLLPAESLLSAYDEAVPEIPGNRGEADSGSTASHGGCVVRPYYSHESRCHVARR